MQETQETWVKSLDWADPLQYEMATHSRILAWKIPWTEEPGSWGHKKSHNQATEQIDQYHYGQAI